MAKIDLKNNFARIESHCLFSFGLRIQIKSTYKRPTHDMILKTTMWVENKD